MIANLQLMVSTVQLMDYSQPSSKPNICQFLAILPSLWDKLVTRILPPLFDEKNNMILKEKL